MSTTAKHSPPEPWQFYHRAATARIQGDKARAAEEVKYGEVLPHKTALDYCGRGYAKIRRSTPESPEWIEGWVDAERRWEYRDHLARRYEAFMHFVPRVTPTSPPEAGETILVTHEGGYGDCIMFSRYLHRVRAAGASVLWRVPPDLVRLARTVFPSGEVVSRLAPLPHADRWMGDWSLPWVPRSKLLSAPPLDYWMNAPIAGTDDGHEARRTAVVWAGTPLFGNDWSRSLTHEAAADLAIALLDIDLTEMDLVSFTRGDRASWLRAMPHGNPTGDWLDTRDALTSTVKTVVTVDTGFAHLAGALGLPTYVLLAYDCCWRWGDDLDTTALYPSMRLFRQPTPGDWSTPIAALVAQLRADAT